MITNIGLFKEEQMALLFNEKKYADLSNNSKIIVMNMFGHIDDDTIIHCKRVEGYMKPDLEFAINDEKHYLSMKSGSNVIVHQENIIKFCEHLKEVGISKYTINTILLYHYGDGTLNGTGKKRLAYNDVYLWLEKRIKLANKELNQNREFVVHMINRLLFKGTQDTNILAEFIYHGDKDYGVIVSRKQVLMHAKYHKYEYLDNLHIGPLMLKPHARYVGKEIKNEKRRNTIEFHWPNYASNLRKIAVRYNSGIL